MIENVRIAVLNTHDIVEGFLDNEAPESPNKRRSTRSRSRTVLHRTMPPVSGPLAMQIFKLCFICLSPLSESRFL